MVQSQSIFVENEDIPSCHAATLVEIRSGLLAAWFGGTHEGHPDVSIWLARMDDVGWRRPIKAADVPDVPLWNPVLFRGTDETTWLFYKIGPNVPAWSGAYIRSFDDGETWTPSTLPPAGLLGPTKNKPIQLRNGRSHPIPAA